MTNNNISPYASLTGYLAEKVDTNLAIYDKDSQMKMTSKLITGSVANSFLFVVGTSEILVRHALFILAKSIHFLIPKEYTEKFDLNILIPLQLNACTTTISTALVASRLVSNYLPTIQKLEVEVTTYTKIADIYTSYPIEWLMNIHINGSRNVALEQVLEDSNMNNDKFNKEYWEEIIKREPNTKWGSYAGWQLLDLGCSQEYVDSLYPDYA